ncbi:hypothetical protein H072_4004 [Dactylellina haptotyla CBS 200.50]|uniref:Major facilitator superfamily (MFS) profile domain-containing protein n=1 Tax=Dactylellina haptotyla (strain CBS 200.50) TaxID=1284197 RepID=S8C2U7_DACHA|nr:hypothetical protein H072_4004 [Dactylellina haptotyla CBS 200.50]
MVPPPMDFHKRNHGPGGHPESEPLARLTQDSDSDSGDDLTISFKSPPLTPSTPSRTHIEAFEIMDAPLLTPPPIIYAARNRKTVLLCILLEVVLIFSFATTALPFTRIVENAVCQRWYDMHDGAIGNQTLANPGFKRGEVPDESMCKTDEIQAGVVEILGVSDTISTVVALLVMFPSGYLAKIIDRRNFLLLAISETAVAYALMGFIGSHPLTFDPRLFWIIPLFDLLGGGFTFFGIMMRTVIAENVPKDELSAVYYKLTGLNILSTFLGTTFGSWLMGVISPIIVLYLGISLSVVLSVPVVLLLPSTKAHKSLYEDVRDPRQFPDSAGDADDEEASPAPPRKKATLYQRFLEQARSKQNLYADVKTLLFEQRAVRNALIILLLFMVARGVRIPFQTWVSKRYEWTLSKTGIILSFESLMGAGALLLLPFMRNQITNLSKKLYVIIHLPPDLLVAMLSLVCQLGSGMILTFTGSQFWFLLSLVVNSPARAFFDGLRSHVISIGDESHIMLVHMSFVIVEIMSGIINGPLWIKVYSYTYSDANKTGLGMGLPFAICSVLTMLTMALLPLARGYVRPPV